MQKQPTSTRTPEPVVIPYKPTPTMRIFHASDEPLRGVSGPISSGKSVGCCIELFGRACAQLAYKGVRRSRFAMIRNCYDDQTEILTRDHGFRLFKDVTDTDLVATLQDGKLVYAKPNSISATPYDGEMIGFESEGVNFLVTPDHEMWVSRCHGRAKVFSEYHMEHAEEVYKRGEKNPCYRVRRDTVWEGQPTDLSDDMFELLGFWYAEGSATWVGSRPHASVFISQMKPEGVQYMLALLEKVGIPYTLAGHQYRISRSASSSAMMFCDMVEHCGNQPIRTVDRSLMNSPPEKLKAFLKGYAAGDGGVGNSGTQVLYTSSKLLADDLQEMAFKAGLVANINTRDRRGKEVHINGRHGVVNHIENIITIVKKSKHEPYLHVFPKNRNRNKGWYKQHYNGIVYCAEMTIPTVYVRRKGKAFWCNRSYPDLLGTTMKTWKAWFPASICQIKMSPPIEGLLRLPLPDGTELAMELVFLAVEKEDDVKRLLSLELTGGYVNEAREVDKAVIDMLIGRTGRYPAVKDGGFTWSGVIMDTNAPDDESWWYNWAEVEKPDGYRFFRQPPAVIPIQKTPESAITWVPNIGTDPRWPQAAENVENLGEKWQYYMKQIPGKSVDWIKSYLMGEYATVCYGRPVYGEYMDSVHYAGGPLNIYAGIPLILGWDYGLTPTCVIAQLSPQGQLRLIEEFCGQDCGVEQFVTQIVKPALKNGYPGMRLLSTGY